MSLTFALFAIVGFLAVVLALEGGYNLWANKHSAESKRIAERLALLRGESRAEVTLQREVEQSRFPRLQALIEGTGPGLALAHWMRAANKATSAAELLVTSSLLALVGLLLPALLGKPIIFGLTLGLVLGVIPLWRLSSARDDRIQKMERQLPEALDLMGRAMRAGHSMPTAIRMVADEMAEPMGRDFRILSDELSYGVPANVAMNNLADRVPLEDARYFVVAMLIQRETGGNLAELLDSISNIIRKRLALAGEVRTLSAEGRLSAWILGAMPFGVTLLLNLINPKFTEVLWTDPLGQRMVGASLFMMLLGGLWMRSIVRIRV